MFYKKEKTMKELRTELFNLTRDRSKLYGKATFSHDDHTFEIDQFNDKIRDVRIQMEEHNNTERNEMITRRAVRSAELKNTVIPESLQGARRTEIQNLNNSIESNSKGKLNMLSIKFTTLIASLVIASLIAVTSGSANADTITFLPKTIHLDTCKVDSCPEDGYNNSNKIVSWNNDEYILMAMENSFNKPAIYAGLYSEETNASRLHAYLTVGVTYGYEADQGNLHIVDKFHLAASFGFKYRVSDRFSWTTNGTLTGIFSTGISYDLGK